MGLPDCEGLYCLECLNDAEPTCVINAHPTERRGARISIALDAATHFYRCRALSGGEVCRECAEYAEGLGLAPQSIEATPL